MDYMWVVVFPLEMIKFLYIGTKFFNVKIRRYWMIAVITVICVGIVCIRPFHIDLFFILAAFLEMIVTFFMIEEKMTKRLTILLKIIFIVSCMDGISKNVLRIIFGNSLENEVIYIILNNMVTVCIFLMINVVRKKYDIKYNGLMKIIIYFCASIMGSMIIIAIMNTEPDAKDVGNAAYLMSNIMNIIYFLSIMSIVLFILYVNDMNSQMKKNLETEQLLKETQKNYYETLLEKEESTRNFRHDMINHMIFLKNLITDGRQDEALDYLYNLQEEMNNIQQKCYDVGNEVIDVMLNYYIGILDKDVSVSVSGKITKNIAMSQVELCTFFSNLIKNAVEALKYQEEGKRYLKILFNTGNENVKVEMINSVIQNNKTSNQKNNKNELPKTTKKDKKNHGIGLKNVKEIVEKNHGMFNWKQDKACFKVQVILPCKKMEIEEKYNV